MLVALALALALVTAATGPAQGERDPVIRLSPAGYVMAPYPASKVYVFITIPEGSDLWCPTITVEWYRDGPKSSHTEDCDPEAEGQPYAYTFRGPSGWAYGDAAIITVVVWQAKRTWVRELTLRVT